jgi:hypothetical protein
MFRPFRSHLQTDILITTLYNNRPDGIMVDKTIREAYSIDIVIYNSHNFYRTITEKLQKCTVLKEDQARAWRLNATYIVGLCTISLI